MTNKLNAGFLLETNEKVYLFQDNMYYRYEPGDRVDMYYPKLIRGNWKNWPSDFYNGIDAALYLPSNKKIYFFKGNKYIRHTFGHGCDSGYPKPIKGNWKNWPSDFYNGIDAALYESSNKKIYFFKGNKYIRHTFGHGCDSGFPKTIKKWKNWPSDFYNGIDAALVWTNGKLIMFKGDKYIRHTFGQGCDSGYPQTVGGTKWDGVFGIFSAKRTINGTVKFRETNQPVHFALIKAWDADIDEADKMCNTQTGGDGKYWMRYAGGPWDSAIGTAFRPDIVVGVFVKARDNRWSRVYKSPEHTNHTMSRALTENVSIHPPDTFVENHTSFDPTVHGFGFDNKKFVVCGLPSCHYEHFEFPMEIIDEMAAIIFEYLKNIFTFNWALCGGMCLSALRRYKRGQSPPMPEFSAEVKEELVRCQCDTLFNQSPHTWAKIIVWQAMPNYPDTVALHTIGYNTISEWIKLKKSIDRGNPKILCLIRVGPTNAPFEVADNHQVVAIGYKQNLYNNEVEVFVYDPNYNGKTSSILFNTQLPQNYINANQITNGEENKTVRGFFIVEVAV
ncbi:MAG: hemopexin repeat-containing protein [Bacteroidota bacterium]